MAYEPNLAFYALFERIIREMLDTATAVNVDLVGTRQDKSTFTYSQELNAGEFDKIPWGKIDAIHDAYWYPAGAPDRRRMSPVSAMLPEFMNVRVFMDVHNNCIVAVVSSDGHTHVVAAGLKGKSRSVRDRETTICDSEDEVVNVIRDAINALFAEYEAEMRMRTDDAYSDYDDSSRYDPLDERNYPLDER